MLQSSECYDFYYNIANTTKKTFSSQLQGDLPLACEPLQSRIWLEKALVQ